MKLKISKGSSRFDTRWKVIEVTWEKLVEQLAKPKRTAETFAEYQRASKKTQGEIKDVGGFVGGVIEGGRRIKKAVSARSLLTLDADNIPQGSDLWYLFSGLYFPQTAACIYTTHSHSALAPRYRLIIPLSREATPDEFEAVSRKVAEKIGLEYFDPTTHQPERLMYWPSAAQDGDFFADHQDGAPLDVDAVLAQYLDWRDAATWPRVAGEIPVATDPEKMQDPREKPHLIGAFCRAYTIEAAIEHFLPHIYEWHADKRYTYKEGESIGGLVVINDYWCFSHHATDPVAGRAVNAYDLVRIHLFGAQDSEADPETPVSKLPSSFAMDDLIKDDPATKKEVFSESIEEAGFADLGAENSEKGAPRRKKSPPDWVTKIKLDRKGKVEQVLYNYFLIMDCDPTLAGLAVYNEFYNRLEITRDAPWRKLEGSARGWQDSDTAALKEYLETRYKLSGSAYLSDALDNLENRNRYHPIRNWLEGLKWDGTPRVARLFIDYLAAEDTTYHRECAKIFMTAAVARVFRPGIKYDYMMTLTGQQGIGKSSLLARLGGEWFSDSVTTFTGKEAMEQIQGSWIIEVGELSATRKSDIEAVKNFITKERDEFRPAYGRMKKEFPRQCVFIGTTNDITFLRDRSGNRRHPVIVCNRNAEKNAWALSQAEREQLWAEAVYLYQHGQPLFLSKELEQEAERIRAAHIEVSPIAGLVAEYLEKDLPANWYELDLPARRIVLSGGEPIGVKLAPETFKRDRVTALEVWTEALQGKESNLTYLRAREINDVIRSLGGWEDKTFKLPGSKTTNRGFMRIS